jgi:hypothetical protein
VETDDGEWRLLSALPWRFVEGTVPRVGAAPSLGQHNQYVFEQSRRVGMEAQVIY